MDTEKVIKGLEQCKIPSIDSCDNCPYGSMKNCWQVLRTDLLALLKEQERIIKQYQKADGFLFAHGWKWEGR